MIDKSTEKPNDSIAMREGHPESWRGEQPEGASG